MRSSRTRFSKMAVCFIMAGLLAAPCIEAAATPVEASRVRVLLLLDTQAPGGETWGLDGENMRALIEHCVQKQGLQGRVTIDHFIGNDCRAANVLSYYEKLNVGANESLLFYYSGHGGFHGKKGHFMALTGGPLYRNDLLAAMNKHNPRLRVVLTDCCANLAGGAWQSEPRGALEHSIGMFSMDHQDTVRREEPPDVVVIDAARKEIAKKGFGGGGKQFGAKAPKKAKNEEPQHFSDEIHGYPGGTSLVKAKFVEPPSTVGRGVAMLVPGAPGGKIAFSDLLSKIDGRLMRELLFEQKGLVDINGCKVGLLSMGTSQWGGSVFTNAFIVLQAEPAPKNVHGTWESFFPSWQQTTDRFARSYTRNMSNQAPEAFSLGSK